MQSLKSIASEALAAGKRHVHEVIAKLEATIDSEIASAHEAIEHEITIAKQRVIYAADTASRTIHHDVLEALVAVKAKWAAGVVSLAKAIDPDTSKGDLSAVRKEEKCLEFSET